MGGSGRVDLRRPELAHLRRGHLQIEEPERVDQRTVVTTISDVGEAHRAGLTDDRPSTAVGAQLGRSALGSAYHVINASRST